MTRRAVLLIALGLAGCATPCEPIRDNQGRIARSGKARADFAKANPCPATGLPKASCPGYRIDHIIPLKRCGDDAPHNMQWLTVEAWKSKTRTE